MAALFDLARQHIWALAIGVGLAGALLLLAGPDGLWVFLGLIVIAGLVTQFLPAAKARTPEPAKTELGGAMLSPVVRRVLGQMPVPVLLLDGQSRVLFVNDSMQGVVGAATERKPISTVLRNPEVLNAIAQTAADGEPATAQFTLPVPIERHYEAYSARVSLSPPVIVLVLHDLTSIRRSERMRADFVANASHELRTPLAAVMGFIDTLKGPARNDEVARDNFLDIMATQAARMRRLIDDLLSLNRIEMNEHVPPHGRIHLEGVVREAAAALEPLAQPDRIAIAIQAAPDTPPVIGERDELIQLFQNLLHNAIKYGHEGGKVRVAIGQEDGHVFAAIKDDGEGIPATAVPRLTERFYRVDVKRSREKGGTGLGLAIVKHIVSRHQGRLTIESKLGEGSTFTVFLPLAPAENGSKTPLPGTVTEVL